MHAGVRMADSYTDYVGGDDELTFEYEVRHREQQ